MKKSLLFLVATTLFAACQRESWIDTTLVVTGGCDAESRTAFGTPSSSEIPYRWSAGDYIWLGNNKSSAIAEECTLAQFEFRGGTAIIGTGHIFYNMTGQAKMPRCSPRSRQTAISATMATSDTLHSTSITPSTWSIRLPTFGLTPRATMRICLISSP